MIEYEILATLSCKLRKSKKTASDQIVRFPITYRSGNRYVHIMLDYYTNLIQEVEIKSIEIDYLIASYEKYHETLTERIYQQVS